MAKIQSNLSDLSRRRGFFLQWHVPSFDHIILRLKSRREENFLEGISFTSFNTKTQKTFEKKNRISLWCKPPEKKKKEKNIG
jgi:hypothetical protein